MKDLDFSSLVGVTLAGIYGCEKGSELVRMVSTDGRIFRMEHYQNCCERVELDDVNGDPEWLLGLPIVQAEAVCSPGGDPAPEWNDSWTWTFYKLSTVKGTVVMRWLGQSNGYYSESVDFCQEAP